MFKGKDITSERFGSLTALHVTGKNVSGSYIWMCKCDCGDYKEVYVTRLLNGKTAHCGCLTKVKNPVANERLFHIWQGIKTRCFNPNAKEYKDYGGRGITLFSAWINDYKAFREWAYSNGYSDELTIDRINNNSGYYPENCRWITLTEQQSNKRNNVFVNYNDEKITLAELSRRTNIGLTSLHQRYHAGDRGERLWRKTYKELEKDYKGLEQDYKLLKKKYDHLKEVAKGGI